MRTRQALVLGLALLAGSCSDQGFGAIGKQQRLVVDLLPPSVLGTRDQPLAIDLGVPSTLKVQVTAVDADGNVDPTFTRYVRISSKPGAIGPLGGQTDTEGRNVLLTNGTSPPFDVALLNGFGTTYVIADDLGYTPVDPLRDPPPACADGLDNDGDGTVDFPADPGCAFANDDSEEGGTFASGQSPPIFYHLPRIADARGLKCEPGNGCSSNGATPYPREAIFLDSGYDDDTNSFAFNVVVTRISGTGFFVQDVSDTSRDGSYTGFNALYAFNFNAPPGMRVCDRITSLGGTASEFFGFTQLSYPTWTLDEWDPSQRECLVPPPIVIGQADAKNTALLLRETASLVRVETDPKLHTHAMITPKFGPGDTTKAPGGSYAPSADATNCDLNHDGKIDFTAGTEEAACSDVCTADPQCTEYSNYAQRSTFRITLADVNGTSAAIQADATAAAGFDPLASKGQELRSFTGTLTYFSGGAQYTIEARCTDDIITDLTAEPLPPEKACVYPRTPLELNPE